LVLEKSTDEFNQSAVLRTAEAFGIQRVWVVEAYRCKTKQGFKARIARTSLQWIETESFLETSDCIAAIRASGRELWVTDLSQVAESLTDACMFQIPPQGIALVVGNESTGVSEEMLAAASRRIYLPLYGWADSLNLNVATALVIQKLWDFNPGVVGVMDTEERESLRRDWYVQLANNEEQRIEYLKWAEEKSVVPLEDLRRPDEFRKEAWIKKKILDKESEAKKAREEHKIQAVE
jgi:tRNA(Leu) C34 or U34 (ribose-2'-O)-methylase TrmL